jgi:parallel beta-helix repeat protein
MLAPNTLLQNRYLIERSIGQGGMGTVYVGIDQRLGNRVALKESNLTEEHLRQAFEREARLLAHSRHSALPKVIDHFSEGAGQFLVMEYIAGDDLAMMLTQRGAPFSVQQVLEWAEELLDALNYLHGQDPPTIHRDIKPANLKLMADGQIILLDFGLAKGSAGNTIIGTNKSIVGYTPKYAPLEQVEGSGTDARSDLYSLAATLYHLLTNVQPPDPLTRFTSLVRGNADPLIPAHEINPLVPKAVSDVLTHALRIEPEARPQTANEMRRLLKAALNASEKSAATLSRSAIAAPAISVSETSSRNNLHTSPVMSSPYSNSPNISQPLISPYAPAQHALYPYQSHVAASRNRSGWLVGGALAAVLLLIGIVLAGLILLGFYLASNQEPETQTEIVVQNTGGNCIVMQTDFALIGGLTLRRLSATTGARFYHTNGSGTFEDCEIVNNAYAGVELTSGGSPVFRNCRINRNGYQGAFGRA